MFLLVPAYPGCPGSKAVKQSLLLLLLLQYSPITNTSHVPPAQCCIAYIAYCMVEYYHAPCPLAAFTLFYVRCATHTHTHPFNGPFSGTAQVSWYPKGNTNLDLNEAKYSECQWHQLGHMQVCTLLQITMPAPHHSVFYTLDAITAAQLTASKH